MSAMTKEQAAQHAKEVAAAYAGIVIPPLALADIEREANVHTSTTRNVPGGPLDSYETFFEEGKRTLWLYITQKMDRATRRPDDTPTTAVSTTAEPR